MEVLVIKAIQDTLSYFGNLVSEFLLTYRRDKNSVMGNMVGGDDIAVNLPTAAANFIWQETNLITQPDGTQSLTSYPRRYFDRRHETLSPRPRRSYYPKALVRKGRWWRHVGDK